MSVCCRARLWEDILISVMLVLVLASSCLAASRIVEATVCCRASSWKGSSFRASSPTALTCRVSRVGAASAAVAKKRKLEKRIVAAEILKGRF